MDNSQKVRDARFTSRVHKRIALAAVLFMLIVSSVGLDWGLPYIWHPDEKVSLAADMIERRSFDPLYFINPSLHVYLVAGIVWVAERLYPGEMKYNTRAITPLTSPANPDRALQFAANLMARGLSVICAGLTVWLLWRTLSRRLDAWSAALATAALGVSLGLMNVGHFVTPEAVLILLITLALAAFIKVGESGRTRDAVVAGALFGLACSTKYTAVLLVFPLTWVFLGVAVREGTRRAARLWTLACVIGVIAFFATTPYAALDWEDFVKDGLEFTWSTGAPANSLVDARRSWGEYGVYLASALGWPLFVTAIGGCLAWVVRRPRDDRAQRVFGTHAVWIACFWGFLGLSPHDAMRFIMPIVPSLAIFAGSGASKLLHASNGVAWRRVAQACVWAVFMYSAAYTAEGASWFVRDTRYVAGAWLKRHVARDAGVSYFAIESYLPYFDRPKYPVNFHSEVWPCPSGDDPRFDAWRRDTLASMDDVIVDTSFFYMRFFDEPNHWPPRFAMYRDLLAGTDPSGYRVVATFERKSPWWLRPDLELVAPTIVIFAKPGQIRE